MKARKIIGYFGGTLFTALIAVVIYARFIQPESTIVELESRPVVSYTGFPATAEAANAPMDFTEAAEASVHAVVHVKTKAFREMEVNPIYEFFFGIEPGDAMAPVEGFGSGVIISPDGYIVTNNHVIDGSDEIEVTLNDRRVYPAKLIGKDPTTDIALLKIDERKLPILSFGNSDKLRLGEWVLAVGNPYNLTSTVTAGIVSAKARDINILRNELSIESFIQTDAAVNPGNSGGALVTTSGRLIGINTAIASRTGSYQGYSFAIPSSIVQKVVADLKEFGEIQRAVIGINILDVTPEMVEEKDLGEIAGVFVSGLTDDGAAKDAGIKIGDVVMAINDIKINSVSELQEQVGRYRPNDLISVIVKRNGKLKQYDLVLRNLDGNTEIVRTKDVLSILGASFETASAAAKRKLGINNGVKVTSLKSGKLMKVGVKKGFIITSINKKPVNNVKEISDVLKDVNGGVMIEGIYGDGSKTYYAFGL
jgi:serine protease Do